MQGYPEGPVALGGAVFFFFFFLGGGHPMHGFGAGETDEGRSQHLKGFAETQTNDQGMELSFSEVTIQEVLLSLRTVLTPQVFDLTLLSFAFLTHPSCRSKESTLEPAASALLTHQNRYRLNSQTQQPKIGGFCWLPS